MNILSPKMLLIACALFLYAPVVFASSPGGDSADIISDIVDTPATVKANGVVRVGWQRDDVPVMVDGLKLPTPAGLGSWAGFKEMPNGGFMLMGDTVVFEDEITPAMDAAFAHDLEITALHNHFVFDSPSVYFMHIGGHGKNLAKLAEGVKAMWDAIKEVRKQHAKPVDRFPGSVPDITGEYKTEALEGILGAEGSLNGEVLKFTFERSATMHGTEFGAPMGLSTWAAFSGNKEHAVVDGDFAMTADEVQAVMHALREANIHIVALHNHMVGETPPYYFLHYWGKGDPEKLAQGIRSALKAQKSIAKQSE
ncbi:MULTISPECIES: DUF1259 domain-containing protein [Idiomarina]|uniref:DUF1259 domain-containing protein n=2 Tax=Idiomarina TaxID=135575 RepID=A0A8I1GAL7_9GAMM|nr:MULTISPECIES: DUF1259 domain-containing protein [Idiomarina]MBJ7268027.1 DUF1259 domain-containing protein [Idiomarina abyssalis]MBJ7273629.1 DUF1259 domain-containing protein [Idiomarina abyssalis]MBJ7316185.1 DUF1259 domain-containing protein [Idiomarina abyssalis]MBJ7316705.1 DUF1259 domain-containing protein [Idiomarina abyssalis]MBL4855501.1 DUF1259 domain-containing protein [Idiomarina sp.]